MKLKRRTAAFYRESNSSFNAVQITKIQSTANVYNKKHFQKSRYESEMGGSAGGNGGGGIAAFFTRFIDIEFDLGG